MPIPPSSYAALAGATVLINLSASERDRDQGRLPAAARREPVRPLPCRLPLYGCRVRRIHDRPRLGRAGHALRKWHASRRIAAVRLRLAACHGRCRPRPPEPGAHETDQFQPDCGEVTGRTSQGSARCTCRRTSPPGEGSSSNASTNGFLLSRATRKDRTNGARRSTRSRCRDW